MDALLALKHTGYVDESVLKFQKIVFRNPHYDETLFVSRFLKSLKHEIMVLVLSQPPETLDRTVIFHTFRRICRHKQDLGRQLAAQRTDPAAPQPAAVRSALKVLNSLLPFMFFLLAVRSRS